jgi:4-hydroxybenzoate polyprenyltransferase
MRASSGRGSDTFLTRTPVHLVFASLRILSLGIIRPAMPLPRFLVELRHLPGLVRFSHSVFALPFALAALVLGCDGMPSLRTLGLVVAAVVLARTAGMAFNRVVDASLDARNPRTAGRHLPAGLVSRPTAWGIVVFSLAAFIGVCALINRLALVLSPLAMAAVLGYSLTKRFTRWSHFFLGVALGIAPIGAWVAACGTLFDAAPWLIAAAVVFWVAGFDIVYATQDTEFDRAAGLHSLAVALGPERALRLVPWLHGAMLVALVAAGPVLGMGWAYYASLLSVVASIVWEFRLVARREDREMQASFLRANALASFGYLGAAILGLAFPPIK